MGEPKKLGRRLGHCWSVGFQLFTQKKFWKCFLVTFGDALSSMWVPKRFLRLIYLPRVLVRLCYCAGVPVSMDGSVSVSGQRGDVEPEVAVSTGGTWARRFT